MQKKDLVNNQIKIFIRISLVVTGFICILVSLIMPHFDNRLNIFQLKGIVLGISVITLYFIPLFKNKFYIFFLYSLFWGIILFFEWLNSLSIYYNPSHVPFFYKGLLFIYQALTLVLSVYFLISILYNIVSLSKRYIKLIEIRNKLIIILFYIIYFVSFFVIILSILKIYDIYIMKINPIPSITLQWGLDDKTNIFQYDLYPYDGFHIQSNSSYGNIKTGDHGFFVDFDLENPPQKNDNEFRIILIGGSAAQGWWGNNNDDMFYRRIEKSLNSALKDLNISVRVINLAMSGAITYQNYIALNKWGHNLKPDLILSVSGVNDLMVTSKSDIPYGFQYAMGLVNVTKHANSPYFLKRIARIFPGIFSHSEIGNAIRILNFSKYTTEAVLKYNISHKDTNFYGYNLYIHSLKSIKRDFEGIPICIVSQPFDYSSYPVLADSYDLLLERAAKELSEYYNSDWFFIDIHKYFKDNRFYHDNKPLLNDFCHMNSAGHSLVSEILTKEIIRIIRELKINHERL